jgi:hypothetical protein
LYYFSLYLPQLRKRIASTNGICARIKRRPKRTSAEVSARRIFRLVGIETIVEMPAVKTETLLGKTVMSVNGSVMREMLMRSRVRASGLAMAAPATAMV